MCQNGFVYLLFILSLSATATKGLAAKKVTSSRSSGGGFGANTQNVLHTPDTSETTQKLVAFLKSQKAKGLEDVEIGYSQETGGRGIYTTRAFSKGKLMCQIPSDCALALSDPSNNGEDVPTLAHAGANFLSMYWQNQQARELWAPYLDALPKIDNHAQFDPTPDFFNNDELELLEFPRLVHQAKARKEQVATVAQEKEIPEEDLRFATWLTASRNFRLSIAAPLSTDEEGMQFDEKGQVITKAGEQKNVQVMIPFIDMANHSSDQPNAKLTLVDPEKDDAWFALEATRPIKAGKEIVIAYGSGAESSVELLLNYGFVPNSNKIDEYMLKKGGDDCISSLDGWTTSLEEDQAMLSMAKDDAILQKILRFRIRMKESYAT